MSTSPSIALKGAERDLVITRVFDAPRPLVFKAWTDPKHAINWWGPSDHPGVHLEMDLRPGGHWRGCLRSIADGQELWQRGTFREIVPPERLVFTFAWEEEGERGLETLVTVTFEDIGGRTRMHFRQTPFVSAAERDGHSGGWNSTFDRLVDDLAIRAGDAPEPPPDSRTVRLERVVAVPPDVAFRLWTDPEHLARWWGPAGFTNPVCRFEARPGGEIRIDMTAPDGSVHPMTGTVHVVEPPSRLVYTSRAVDPGGKLLIEGLNTITFVAEGGGTRISLVSSAVARAPIGARMMTGMEAGWRQSLDRLEALADPNRGAEV